MPPTPNIAEDRARAILDFWFGLKGSPESEGPRKLWFKKDPAFDAQLRAAHLADYERARDGELDGWREAPETCLALVVTLDQFPRNLFRGDARAFATDAKALKAAAYGIERGFDQDMPAHRRVFF
ncbi:MAG: DUF924 family protein, partial [Rhodospirillaceae bacterium]